MQHNTRNSLCDLNQSGSNSARNRRDVLQSGLLGLMGLSCLTEPAAAAGQQSDKVHNDHLLLGFSTSGMNAASVM